MAFKNEKDIRTFLKANRDIFEKRLLVQAKTVKDKIEEIKAIGNINLIANAERLVLLVVDEADEEVDLFAKQEGGLWAKYALTLSFKLEWVQAIRRTLWEFLYEWDKLNQHKRAAEDFYQMEEKTNQLIDQFLNGFFISYSKAKDELIEEQRKLVDNLSVPIIPITQTVSILPLIGRIDSYRANIIEEKVLLEIGRLRVETLIMDLSGIAQMDEEAIQPFLRLLDGIEMMGCRPVITGLRPEIVRSMATLNIDFGKRAETKGTLQSVLHNYL